MSMNVGGVSGGAIRPRTGDESVTELRAGHAPPSMDATMIPEGMGIEFLAAMLMTESAKESKKLMKELKDEASQSQVRALREQVAHLHEKADDMAAEGWVTGAITAAGGALTLASAAASPSISDSTKAAQWQQAGAKYGAGFAAVSKQCELTLAAQQAMSGTLTQLAMTTNGLAGPLGKVTYGAQQIHDDAEATRAAADAKFAEAARDEYAALAKDFDAGASKALQMLQSMTADRQSVRRGILQRM